LPARLQIIIAAGSRSHKFEEMFKPLNPRPLDPLNPFTHA
jgi:hypothetical protein